MKAWCLTWNKSTHICSQLETVGVGDLAHLDPLSPAPSALTNHWGLTLQYNNLILWCNFYYALSSSQGDYILSKHNFPIFTRPFQRLILIYLKWVDALWKRSYFENFLFHLTLDWLLIIHCHATLCVISWQTLHGDSSNQIKLSIKNLTKTNEDIEKR